jgi:hypothetical protein
MKELQPWRGDDLIARREWLRLGSAAGALCLLNRTILGGILMSDEKLIPAKAAVDHLLLGVADLDQGIAWVEKTTGVKAVVGGVHPGAGTRNALLSLGGRRYLEIIAPDPAQTAYNFQIDVRRLAEPRLITWAAATSDIESVAQKARASGYQLFGPRDGSRARPDGKTLKWKSLGVLGQLGVGSVDPIPFFIQWSADSLHPSQDSPKGCELQSLELEHPDPAAVIDTLKKLGLEAKVKPAKEARLRATLKTPKGKVELG